MDPLHLVRAAFLFSVAAADHPQSLRSMLHPRLPSPALYPQPLTPILLQRRFFDSCE